MVSKGEPQFSGWRHLVTPSLQNVVLRLKLKPEELKLLKQAVADWKWSAFDAHQRMAARCKMNDGREPTKETMDMAWNAYKMAEDIGDRIADATSPQNPGVHPSPAASDGVGGATRCSTIGCKP